MVKQILLILLLSIATFVVAQTTSIPDANFEQALINLGLDTGVVNGTVPTANIDTVVQLWVVNQNIADLTGIEDFLVLDTLWCGQNQITSLNMSQNSALRFLNCNSMPSLTSLDVTQNSVLIELYCGGFGCQLTTIDVSQNLALERFYCAYNLLTNLDVTANTALTYLDFSWNSIGTIDLSQNTALASLNCNYNLLPSLDVTANPSLYMIGCGWNQLSSIDFTQNPALRLVNVSSNQLTSLDMSFNPLLRELRCYSNQLTDLSLTQNPDLDMLFCDTNQLTCLNIKNGTNTNFIVNFPSLKTENNPNLTCIEVDNPAWNLTGWGYVDPWTSFSSWCQNPCSVGLEDYTTSPIIISPNPTSDQITLSIEERATSTLEIRNSLGQIVLSRNLEDADKVTLDLSFLPKSIYFLHLDIGNQVITKKIIKN
jgi:hypothetical protein